MMSHLLDYDNKPIPIACNFFSAAARHTNGIERVDVNIGRRSPARPILSALSPCQHSLDPRLKNRLIEQSNRSHNLWHQQTGMTASQL
jgi:hypothetical protein